MIPQPEREQIVALINREVVPAIGCTEPIAVALCVAKATEILGTEPERIVARLSANILKNAMGVGIPGTGMIGLPIAIALGALIGKSAYRLEVLRDVDAEAMTLSPKARGKFLSEFSIATAQQLFDRWSKLDKYLLVKYMDGNVKSEHAGVLEYLDGKGGPAHFVDNGNGKQIPDKIQFPGYNEKWKRAVVADHGEVLKVIQ